MLLFLAPGGAKAVGKALSLFHDTNIAKICQAWVVFIP